MQRMPIELGRTFQDESLTVEKLRYIIKKMKRVGYAWMCNHFVYKIWQNLLVCMSLYGVKFSDQFIPVLMNAVGKVK